MDRTDFAPVEKSLNEDACKSKQSQQALHYEAFISYRHHPVDVKTAQAVQHALEGFRIPRELRKTASRPKLGKLFRDTSELAASPSLSKEIESALESSRFLIVVCSPRAKESEWMTKEIEAFIQFHGTTNILTVLADGEPETSFPAVLAALSEPLAADFRPGKTRRQTRTETLRLAAPIIGCSFDDLAQRTKERRNRFALRGALAAAAAGVAFGGFSLWQQNQIMQNYRAMQQNESEYLAQESLDLYDQGKRMEAIQVAMAALPDSETSDDRPLVDSAQFALSKALGIYPEATQARSPLNWRAEYSLSNVTNPSTLTSSTNQNWFALLEDERTIALYDVETGVRRAISAPETRTERPGAFVSYGASILACGSTIVAPYEYDTLIGFDAQTGEERWRAEVKGTASTGGLETIAASENEEHLITATSMNGNNEEYLLISTINPKTGEVEHQVCTAADQSTLPKLAIDPSGLYAAASIDSKLLTINFASDSVTECSVAESSIVAVMATSQAAYAISMPEDETAYSTGSASAAESTDITIAASSASVERFAWGESQAAWSSKQQWKQEESDSANGFFTIPAFVRNKDFADGDYIAATFDRYLVLFVSETGEDFALLNGDSPCVFTDMHFNRKTGNLATSVFTHAGTLYLSKSGGIDISKASGYNIPQNIWQATQLITENGNYIVACPSDDLRTITVYRRHYVDQLPSYQQVLSEEENTLFSQNSDMSRLIRIASNCEAIQVLDTANLENLCTISLADLGISLTDPANVTLKPCPTDPASVILADKGSTETPARLWAINIESRAITATWQAEQAPTIPSLSRIDFPENGQITVYDPMRTSLWFLDPATLAAEKRIDNIPIGRSAETAYAVRAHNRIIKVFQWGSVSLCGDDGKALPDAPDFPSIEGLGSSASNLRLVVSPDTSHFTYARDDGYLACYSMQDGMLAWEIPFAMAGGGSIRYTPDGKYLLCQTGAKTFMLVEASTGKATAHDPVDGLMAYDAQRSTDGTKLFVRAAAENMVLQMIVFDISAGQFEPIAQIPYAMAVLPDEQTLVLGNATDVYTLPLRQLDSMLEVAKAATTNHQLTDEQRKRYHIG